MTPSSKFAHCRGLIQKGYPRLCGVLGLLVVMLLTPALTLAQDPLPTPAGSDEQPAVPERVDVQPIARDDEIETRLRNILDATGWFIGPRVRVEDGVVFLEGEAQSDEFKDWAGELARNTQDVAAVVNQLSVVEAPLLDFEPVWTSLREQTRLFLRSLPIIAFSSVILAIAGFIARLLSRMTRHYLKQRSVNTLLRNVISRTVGIFILLLGLYLVFQVAGLTSIALTILGGTGLLGLILGIAFRDITENFLASIFLSIQNPFSVDDLVEVAGVSGYVQRMTTRTTILMTLAGNHVQIPNATVYKSIIYNYTSNPNRRIEFTIGIGYDDSIALAQETIRQLLEEHPAVLNDPEHLVLVDSLGSATINLQIYFWIDGSQLSWTKVKSSVVRLVKRAIVEAGISMPDEAREMIFPNGVPVTIVDRTTESDAPQASARAERNAATVNEDEPITTRSEGGLTSEAEEINSQAQHSRVPEGGENLLASEQSD